MIVNEIFVKNAAYKIAFHDQYTMIMASSSVYNFLVLDGYLSKRIQAKKIY